MEKNYSIYLDLIKVGTTRLEKADAPMGVVFGLIEFNGIEAPYEFIKEYCSKNNITVNTDDSEYEFIDTHDIPELKVYREDGMEIKGVAGNSICGLKEDGYEISILGIEYPFYQEEFPHHRKAYDEMFK